MPQKPKQRMFFKDYKTVVPFLEKVFYNGCMSQSDFAEQGIIQKSKYYDSIKTLKFAFGVVFTEEKDSKGNKVPSLRIDHFYEPHKGFYRFFALKSFISTEHLSRVCFILQKITSDGGCSIDTLTKGFYDLPHERPEDETPRTTVENLVKKLHSKGILRKEGSKYYVAYPASSLKNSDVLMLADLCSNIFPLSILGSSIIMKANMYYQSPFLFKYRSFVQMFSDEKIYDLLIAIQNRQHICITKKDGGKLYDLLPYRIITNRESGRQYVFVVYVGSEAYDEYLLLRIDRIGSISAGKSKCVIPDEDTLKEKYDTAFRYSFNGTTIMPRDKEPQEGTLVYHKSFERNVMRHFPYAKPEPVDDTHSRVRVKVDKFIELKPWLRSNWEKVRLTECSDGVIEELSDELKCWRDMYGIT